MSQELESHIGLLLLCLAGLLIGAEHFLDDFDPADHTGWLIPAAIIAFSLWGLVKNSRLLFQDALGDAERDYDEREGDDDVEPRPRESWWRGAAQLAVCLLLLALVAWRLVEGWDDDPVAFSLALAAVMAPAAWYAYMAIHRLLSHD